MATSDDVLWSYHLRRSLGEALTPEEQSDLAAWYAQQDQAEMETLRLSVAPSNTDALRQQVDGILERIVATSRAIQALAKDNETLRHENRALRQQLAQRAVLEPA